MTQTVHVSSHNGIEAEGAPTTAAAVANAFLDIQKKDKSRFPYIDQMKLQKLVFYAHAWWLALKGQPLFGDDVEAWPWGPVIRDIYNDFSCFGRHPIDGKRAVCCQQYHSGDEIKYKLTEPEPPNNEVMTFLKQVWEKHKKYTGIQLSNATHAPGEPWTIIKENYNTLDSKPRIPNTLIQQVFKNKISASSRE